MLSCQWWEAYPLTGCCPVCVLPLCVLQASLEERARLLSFVVCGGGPTGVEVAAELHDMVFHDLKVRGRGTWWMWARASVGCIFDTVTP